MAAGPSNSTFDLFADSSTDLFNDCKNYLEYKNGIGSEQKIFGFKTENEINSSENAQHMIPDDSQDEFMKVIPDDSQDEFLKNSCLFEHIVTEQNVSTTLSSSPKQKVQQTISQALELINDAAVKKKNTTSQKNKTPKTQITKKRYHKPKSIKKQYQKPKPRKTKAPTMKVTVPIQIM